MSYIIVESQNVKKISPDPTYVTLGDTLVLKVTYDFTGKVGVSWRNGSGSLLYERARLGGEDNPDKRASLEGQATLILKNTALYDNGRYKVTVLTVLWENYGGSTSKSATFDVIIQGKQINYSAYNHKYNIAYGYIFENYVK